MLGHSNTKVQQWFVFPGVYMKRFQAHSIIEHFIELSSVCLDHHYGIMLLLCFCGRVMFICSGFNEGERFGKWISKQQCEFTTLNIT